MFKNHQNTCSMFCKHNPWLVSYHTVRNTIVGSPDPREMTDWIWVRFKGSYGLTWALKNSSKLLKVAILNRPLTVSSPVPGVLKQLRLPLFGEFTCQNAILAERFIEAGLDRARLKSR
ncbi:uncharacterized protein [Triticum aestivum]|uniref:uncharacterized protein n=1 Tax=Triticum aestivum TaxID=4565 RepID=UPI001D0243F1|nr:uncharacterized protein LOC123054950 [Triticum aestivum]